MSVQARASGSLPSVVLTRLRRVEGSH